MANPLIAWLDVILLFRSIYITESGLQLYFVCWLVYKTTHLDQMTLQFRKLSGFPALPGNLELPGIWTFCLEVGKKPGILKKCPKTWKLPWIFQELYTWNCIFYFPNIDLDWFVDRSSVDCAESLWWKLTWKFTKYPWKLPENYLEFYH